MRYVFSWQPPRLRMKNWCRAVHFGLAVALMAGITSPAWAQGKAKGKTPPGMPGTPGGAGGSHGAPGAKKPAAKKTTTPLPKPPTPGPSGEPVNDETGLPLGFTPKKEVPEIMLLEQPLATEDELAKWRKERSKFDMALRNGDMSPAGKSAIQNGLKYYTALMTSKDKTDGWQTLSAAREDLTVRKLPTAGSILPNEKELRKFRQYLMEEVVKAVRPLLKNNFYVRVHAATLLGELTLIPETNEQKKLVYETFIPAIEPLREVLRDPEQPTAVKIPAARSMTHLIRYGDLHANKKLEFSTAKDVLAELANRDKNHFWYNMRLVELLSTIEMPYDPDSNKPTIVLELTSILRDPKQNWHVRAEAARALGRVPFDPQVNISSLVQDLTQFALEMSKAAQQAPKEPQWGMTFFKLYLAFQPLDSNDKDSTKKLKGGLLNNPAATSAAQQPYNLIVPIVNAVINKQPITAEHIKGLEDWLAKNRPVQSATNEAKQPSPNGAGTTTAGNK